MDAFSPNHFVISRIFENIGIFIIDSIVNGPDTVLYFVIRIIMFTLLILSSFIFNEFLIINIGKLSKNTHLFLDYEANKEKHESICIEEQDGDRISIETNDEFIEIPNVNNIDNYIKNIN